MNDILISVSTQEVRALLPDTAQGLQALASLNQATLEQQLHTWQRARDSRLVAFSARLTPDQLETVRQALGRFLHLARDSTTENPNLNGNALYLMALNSLNTEKKYDDA